MEEFDFKAHARLIGSALKVMGVLALAIALAGLVPDHIFSLPPHFLGNVGAIAIGGLLFVSGALMQK